MQTYSVAYESNTITENTPNVDPTGCSSITFENYGDEDILINGDIKLDIGTSLVFSNEPYEVIKTKFRVQFAGGGINPKMLIIRKYSLPIKIN